MSVKSRLQDDMKQALRAGEKARLSVIRMALAAIQQREVDERIELDDAAVLGVIEKMIKQRRESVEQYRAGGRGRPGRQGERRDRAAVGLPARAARRGRAGRLIDAAIAATGATSMKDMGRVMTELRAVAQGRADMAVLSAQVKARLAG
jgi:uncharacterized protein